MRRTLSLTICPADRSTPSLTSYGIVEGIAIDTHMIRLSNAFGLTDQKNPEKIEQDLMELLPKEEWFDFTYRMIEYGRNYYPAHKLKSKDHPLGDYTVY